MVIGVVHRPAGRLYEAAGLDGIRVYVSYESLKAYGRCNGINHYEIVMPNPVREYAVSYVREQLGQPEREIEVLENSTRFGISKRLRMLLDFGTRSMNGKSITYPYLENVARGYEDILALITLFQMIFVIYPSALALVWIVIRWKNKKWNSRTVMIAVQDKLQRAGDRYRERRRARKAGEEESWLDEKPRAERAKRKKAEKREL